MGNGLRGASSTRDEGMNNKHQKALFRSGSRIGKIFDESGRGRSDRTQRRRGAGDPPQASPPFGCTFLGAACCEIWEFLSSGILGKSVL